MKKRLRNLISGILIGSSIISSVIGGELENKIIINKNQKEKVVIFNREISEDIINNSYMNPSQNLAYETTNKTVYSNERKIIENYIEEPLTNKTSTQLSILREDNGRFVFTYKNEGRKDLSEKEKRRIPNYEEFFREDTKNVHIYFLYPPNSKLNVNEQHLEILNNKTESVRQVNTREYEETDLYNTVSKVNDFFSLYEAIKLNVKEVNETEKSEINNLAYNSETSSSLNLDRWLFQYLPEENPQVKLAKKIPGKTGKILKGAIFLSKALMNEIEKQNRLKFWEKGLSKDWNVKEMPLLVGEKINPFQDNIISRETSFTIEGDYNKFYLMISSLPYITGMTTTRTTGIEDILIEIEK